MDFKAHIVKTISYAVVISMGYSNLYAGTTGNNALLPVASMGFLTAGSVITTTDDTASAFYNPAGLAALKQDEIQVSASTYSFTEYSEGKGISSQIDTIPSFVGSAYKFKNGTLAWFYSSPINNRFYYEQIEEKVGEGNSFQTDEMVSMRVAGLGWGQRASRKFSWGFTLYGISLDLTQTSSSHEVIDQTATVKRKESKISGILEVQALNLTGILGMLYKVNSRLKMGLKYQMPSYHLGTTLKMHNTGLIVEHESSNVITWFNITQKADSKDAVFTIPDSLTYAISYETRRWLNEVVVTWTNNHNATEKFKASLEQDVELGGGVGNAPPTAAPTTYESFDESAVPSDTINVSFGSVYNMNRQFKIGMGLFTDMAKEKEGKGMDIFGITGGFQKKSKYGYNYLGFMYRKGFDRGKNTRTENEVEIPITKKFESGSMSLSSTVFF